MTDPTPDLPFDRGPHRERKRRAARARSVVPVSPSHLVPEVQADVLEHLARLGDLSKAAALAGTTMAAVRARARDDEEFAAALEEAWADYRDAVLIPAAARRAVEGVFEPTYYRGAPARDHSGGPKCRDGSCDCPPGGKRNYSDALLLRLLEVLDPRFRQTRVVQTQKLPPVTAMDIDSLSPEAREKLQALLDQMELDRARPAEVLQPDDTDEQRQHDHGHQPPAA